MADGDVNLVGERELAKIPIYLVGQGQEWIAKVKISYIPMNHLHQTILPAALIYKGEVYQYCPSPSEKGIVYMKCYSLEVVDEP